MNIINLTPHDVVYSNKGNFKVIETSGLARCTMESKMVDIIDNIPVNQNSYGEVIGLPEE